MLQKTQQIRLVMALPGATWAPTLYRKLGGILCVYKPADVAMDEVLKRIQFNLARGKMHLLIGCRASWLMSLISICSHMQILEFVIF